MVGKWQARQAEREDTGHKGGRANPPHPVHQLLLPGFEAVFQSTKEDEHAALQRPDGTNAWAGVITNQQAFEIQLV